MNFESVLAANYGSLVRQIARIEWAMCDNEIDGCRIVNHRGENNHNAPCDMLARLGVMHVSVPDNQLHHCFPPGWSPFADLVFHRHSGEPTAHDLWLGITFWIHWFPREATLSHRGQSVSVDANFNTLIGRTSASNRYLIWAVQGACELLNKHQLGWWSDPDGTFQIFDPKSTVDSIEEYWSSRAEAIHRLGKSESLYPD